ncbi:MAG: malate dehydrogenase [Candidatus Omnitrophica bacterium]|nr:malate dehydrogenase [Candidatus Omnitrophota bacterium]
MPTITIVGAGQVGATTAHLLLMKGLADLVLLDVVEGLAKGKALDLAQAAATEGLPVRVAGGTDDAAMAGSRLVVVTAGLARKPGMSREDLLDANAAIVGPIADQIAARAPEAVVVVVTNPLDIMTALVLKRTGFPRARVVGMAGALDSGRLCAFVAERLQVSPASVQGMVLGSHGDLMVSVKSSITVDGKPLASLLPPQEVDQLIARTRDAGAEIVALLKTSSAYYAPATGVVQMIQAVLRDAHAVLPASVRLEGEYGLREVCIGVPVELGAQGVAKIVTMPLTDDEQHALHRAAEQVREGIAHVTAKAAA